MRTADNRAQHIDKNIDITPLSLKLKQRIIKFYGHIIRSDPNTDQMRAISIDEDGNRISAPKLWKSGRPKLKWYNAAKPLVTHLLKQFNIPPNTWRTYFSQYEVNINTSSKQQMAENYKQPLLKPTTSLRALQVSLRAPQPSPRAIYPVLRFRSQTKVIFSQMHVYNPPVYLPCDCRPAQRTL